MRALSLRRIRPLPRLSPFSHHVIATCPAVEHISRLSCFTLTHESCCSSCGNVILLWLPLLWPSRIDVPLLSSRSLVAAFCVALTVVGLYLQLWAGIGYALQLDCNWIYGTCPSKIPPFPFTKNQPSRKFNQQSWYSALHAAAYHAPSLSCSRDDDALISFSKQTSDGDQA